MNLPISELLTTLISGILLVWLLDLTIRLVAGRDHRTATIAQWFVPQVEWLDLYARRDQPSREEVEALQKDRDPKQHQLATWSAAVGVLAIVFLFGHFANQLSNTFYDSPGIRSAPLGAFGDEELVRSNVYHGTFAEQYRRAGLEHEDWWWCKPVRKLDDSRAVANGIGRLHLTLPGWFPGVLPHDQDACRESASDQYYLAKTSAWVEGSHVPDLRKLQEAIDITRSLALIGYAGVMVSLLGFALEAGADALSARDGKRARLVLQLVGLSVVMPLIDFGWCLLTPTSEPGDAGWLAPWSTPWLTVLLPLSPVLVATALGGALRPASRRFVWVGSGLVVTGIWEADIWSSLAGARFHDGPRTFAFHVAGLSLLGALGLFSRARLTSRTMQEDPMRLPKLRKSTLGAILGASAVLMLTADLVWSTTEGEFNKLAYGAFLGVAHAAPLPAETDEGAAGPSVSVAPKVGVPTRRLEVEGAPDGFEFEPSGVAVVHWTPNKKDRKSKEGMWAFFINDGDQGLVLYRAPADGFDRAIVPVVPVSIPDWKADPPPKDKGDGKGETPVGKPKFEDLAVCRGPHCGALLPECAERTDRKPRCLWAAGSGSFQQAPYLHLIDPSSGKFKDVTFIARAVLEAHVDALLDNHAPPRSPRAVWLKVEGLADLGDGRLWFGLRQVGTSYTNFRYMRAIVEARLDDKGKFAGSGLVWNAMATFEEGGDKHTVGLSSLEWDPTRDGVLAVYSEEFRPTRWGVWSELRLLKGTDPTKWGEATSLKDGKSTRLAQWTAKAEGVAVFGDGLLVVFDSDDDRKGATSSTKDDRYDLKQHQDFYEVVKP